MRRSGRRTTTRVDYAALNGGSSCGSAPVGSREWLDECRDSEESPRSVLAALGLKASSGSTHKQMWKLAASEVNKRERESRGAPLPPPRVRLSDYSTLDDVLDSLGSAQNIVVLTGAGISVSCGIPDFRSAGGLYDQIAQTYDLPDPQLLFDLNYFHQNPAPFYSFAKALYPGQFQPGSVHRLLLLLEQQGRLLRNYTQNIDTLEDVVGLPTDRVVQCHGSFREATCTNCGVSVQAASVEAEVLAERVPRCTSCGSGVMKPGIVMFGEQLSVNFHESFAADMELVDLFLVFGSSLSVAPISTCIRVVPPNVPQILVNREIVGAPNEFDVNLLGDCDVVVGELCRRLGWVLPRDGSVTATTATTTTSTTTTSTTTTTATPTVLAAAAVGSPARGRVVAPATSLSRPSFTPPVSATTTTNTYASQSPTTAALASVVGEDGVTNGKFKRSRIDSNTTSSSGGSEEDVDMNDTCDDVDMGLPDDGVTSRGGTKDSRSQRASMLVREAAQAKRAASLRELYSNGDHSNNDLSTTATQLVSSLGLSGGALALAGSSSSSVKNSGAGAKRKRGGVSGHPPASTGLPELDTDDDIDSELIASLRVLHITRNSDPDSPPSSYTVTAVDRGTSAPVRGSASATVTSGKYAEVEEVPPNTYVFSSCV